MQVRGREEVARLWFDAGYFVETLRQAGFVYKYDMLSAAEKSKWQLRGEASGFDGVPWLDKAMRTAAAGSAIGREMRVAMQKVIEYREADLRAQARR